MEMNDENNFAKVVWKAGDRFLMLGADDHFAVFTTDTDGERVPFTTTNVTPAAPKHCYFSETHNAKFYIDEDVQYFGFDVPHAQEAVAGKVKDAYLRSYARTDNDTDFYFRSTIALVRFKLKGSIVSSVHSVRLEGASRHSERLLSQVHGWDQQHDPDLRQNHHFCTRGDHVSAGIDRQTYHGTGGCSLLSSFRLGERCDHGSGAG